MKKELKKSIYAAPKESATMKEPHCGNAIIEEKRPQVETELIALVRFLIDLQNVVDTLEKRLEPVLLPREVNPTCDAKADMGLVPVAEEIRKNRHTVMRLIEQIEGLNRRIEI